MQTIASKDSGTQVTLGPASRDNWRNVAKLEVAETQRESAATGDLPS